MVVAVITVGLAAALRPQRARQGLWRLWQGDGNVYLPRKSGRNTVLLNMSAYSQKRTSDIFTRFDSISCIVVFFGNRPEILGCSYEETID